MNNNYYSGFENLAVRDKKRAEEKQKIRSVANIIGVAYILLWLLPTLISRLISDIYKIFNAESLLAELYSDPAFIMLLQTVISVLMFTLPFIIIPISRGKKLHEFISFAKPEKGLLLPLVLIGVGVSAFANIATSNIAAFFSGFGIEFLSPDIQYPTGVLGFVLSFIAVAITPALTEEFAMRGVVMGSLKEYGESFSVLLSAAVFALVHGNLVQIPFAFLMGIIIGFAVIKTNSLWTGVIIHLVNNGISVSLNYLNDTISSVLLQNGITIFYFAVCFLCFFVGLAILRNKKEIWKLSPSNTLLSLGEKLKYFAFSPCIIISIGLTVIDCIGYIYIR